MKNYYDILDILPTATKDEIKSAFRKKARKYHPDVNHTIEAEIIFKQINLAAKTLLDDNMRSQYDFAYGFNKKTDHSKQKKFENARYNYTKAKESYKKQTDFAQYFYNFFKETQKTAKTPKKINGEDIVTNVTIAFDEALKGTSRKVNILQSEKCPKCFGAKFVNGSKCTFCEGKGEKVSYKKINIKIPSGIKDGAKIRVKNEGEEGKFGGKNGDLYLIVHIEKNAAFKSMDGFAYLEVPIDPSEAVLGAQIKIPVPDCGTKVLKIPPKTRANTTFKLMESGFLNAQTNKRDPLMVKVFIDISPCMRDKEIEMYRIISQEQNNTLREDFYDRKNYN